ncbi:MAG: 2-oxo-4-hydroxy-4-carboxy-5-ureidoimidazoline decarboxylase [Thermomicrobiales bacterium]
MKLRHINNLPEVDVEERLGNIYEDTPWIVRSGLQWRPFVDIAEFHRVLCDLVLALSDEEQLSLIRAHPDLIGRAALSGQLGTNSAAEQREAGLDVDALSLDDQVAFTSLNTSYRDRFGFPFVVCVREHRKRTILAAFEQRLKHDRQEEVRTAIGEINKIAGYRLLDVIEN